MTLICKNCGYPLSAHAGGRLGFSGCEDFQEIEEKPKDQTQPEEVQDR